jgi:hypothetical protein
VQHDRAFGRCLVARLFSGPAKRRFDGDPRARILRLNFAPRHRGAIRARFPQKKELFLSYLHGGHEAASRNEPGQFASFADYLPYSFGVGR